MSRADRRDNGEGLKAQVTLEEYFSKMWDEHLLEDAYKQMDQPSQYEQTDGAVQDNVQWLRIVPVDEGHYYPDNVIEVF